jgi:ABC-type uncharacterized transport system substrate-binding protein
MKKVFIAAVMFLFLISNAFCEQIKKKVFYINSYHKGYGWSDEITNEILKAFNVKVDKDGNIDDSQSNIYFRMVYMNTKLNNDEQFKTSMAFKIKNMIDEWKPDVLITSDDNAVKYVVMPYYKNADLPVVFCGINMDASVYDLPYKNTTGMVEILLLNQGLKILKPYAKNDALCSLSSDTLSDHKIVEISKKHFHIYFESYFVSDFNSLKAMYESLQNSCGILFITEPFSVKGFKAEEYKNFIYEKTKIPVFTAHTFVKEYALLTVGAMGQEQGKWAAETAKRILNGEKPSDIPMVTNKRAQIFLNMKLAKILNIKFPIELIENSYFVSEGIVE